MISTENLKRFNLEHIKNFFLKLIFLIILCYFSACSKDNEIKKTSWNSSLDYFSEQQGTYEVTYFVDVGAKEAYVGGVLEIYKLPKMEYLDRIKVTAIEFFERIDGFVGVSDHHLEDDASMVVLKVNEDQRFLN